MLQCDDEESQLLLGIAIDHNEKYKIRSNVKISKILHGMIEKQQAKIQAQTGNNCNVK